MSDKVKRERAFELYYQSGGIGKKRSIEGLWKSWVAEVRDDPSVRPNVPTLNRETIYKWSKEDDWIQRAADRDQGVTEKLRESYEEARERGFNDMNLMIPKAVETLVDAMDNAAYREKIAAANSLLDRVGLIPLTKTKMVEPETKKKQGAAPPVDADEDTLIAWLQEAQGGNNG